MSLRQKKLAPTFDGAAAAAFSNQNPAGELQ
jgi:hypothetical protein